MLIMMKLNSPRDHIDKVNIKLLNTVAHHTKFPAQKSLQSELQDLHQL